MKRTDRQRLDIALEHLDAVGRHLSRGGLDDELIFDAVCQRLAAAIEEVGGVSASILDEEFGAAWPAIQATRNVIAHNYRFVDAAIVQATITRDLPRFRVSVTRIRESTERP